MVFYWNSYKPIILVAFVLLFYVPIPATTLWWREVFNSGHTVLFLLISLLLYSQINAIHKFSNPIFSCLIVLVIGLIAGAAVELSQGLLSRETSLADLYKDFFGILAGLSLAFFIRQKTRRARVLTISLAFVFLMTGMYSLFQIGWHYIQRSQSFPVVIALDESWSTSFMQFNNSELLGEEKVNDNDGAAYHRFKFHTGRYPGFGVIEPEEDWSAYRVLRFNVYSANEKDIKLVLRVHDKQHNHNFNDRFNRAFILHPGLNAIMVEIEQIQNAPYGRKMDMTKIADIQLFLDEVDIPLFLDFSNIYIDR